MQSLGSKVCAYQVGKQEQERRSLALMHGASRSYLWAVWWNYSFHHPHVFGHPLPYLYCEEGEYEWVHAENVKQIELSNLMQHLRHNVLLPDSWCEDFVSVKCTKLLGLIIAMERAVITSLWKTSGSSSLPSRLQLFRHCTALLSKDWS